MVCGHRLGEPESPSEPRTPGRQRRARCFNIALLDLAADWFLDLWNQAVRKAGVLDVRRRMRARGGSRIPTIGPAKAALAA
jgi:hypothetical protein